MKKYISTFTTGLSEPVKSFLKSSVKNTTVLNVWDGLIYYKTEVKSQFIKSIPVLSNSFEVFYFKSNVTSLERFAQNVLNYLNKLSKFPRQFDDRNSFRILYFDKNTPSKINWTLNGKIEKNIIKHTKLKLMKSKADFEFCFHYRDENIGFFSIKIKSKNIKKGREKGELKHELAHILVQISEPKFKEIVIDPFAGNGSIPICRAKVKGKPIILASDIDKENTVSLKKKVKYLKLKDRIIVRQLDALSMTRYEDNSIDKIITDPAWGIYQKIENINEFYNNIFNEFYRVLALSGLIVILVSREISIKTILNQNFKNKLIIKKEFETLVSGKKATIYKIGKLNFRHESLSN